MGAAELWTAGFDSIAGERRLRQRFEVATLDGFGAFDRAALCAAGGLLAYLDEVARESLPFLRPPVARASGDHMMIDAATRESLELTLSASGTRAGSLLAAVDRTVTGAGARLLAADLGAPLLDRPTIEARLDLVALFEGDSAAARLASAAIARPARHRPGARPARRRARIPARSRPASRRPRRGAPPARPPRPNRRASGPARPAASGAHRPWRSGRPARARAGPLAADRYGAGRLYRGRL